MAGGAMAGGSMTVGSMTVDSMADGSTTTCLATASSAMDLSATASSATTCWMTPCAPIACSSYDCSAPASPTTASSPNSSAAGPCVAASWTATAAQLTLLPMGGRVTHLRPLRQQCRLLTCARRLRRRRSSRQWLHRETPSGQLPAQRMRAEERPVGLRDERCAAQVGVLAWILPFRCQWKLKCAKSLVQRCMISRSMAQDLSRMRRSCLTVCPSSATARWVPLARLALILRSCRRRFATTRVYAVWQQQP